MDKINPKLKIAATITGLLIFCPSFVLLIVYPFRVSSLLRFFWILFAWLMMWGLLWYFSKYHSINKRDNKPRNHVGIVIALFFVMSGFFIQQVLTFT